MPAGLGCSTRRDLLSRPSGSWLVHSIAEHGDSLPSLDGSKLGSELRSAKAIRRFTYSVSACTVYVG